MFQYFMRQVSDLFTYSSAQSSCRLNLGERGVRRGHLCSICLVTAGVILGLSSASAEPSSSDPSTEPSAISTSAPSPSQGQAELKIKTLDAGAKTPAAPEESTSEASARATHGVKSDKQPSRKLIKSTRRMQKRRLKPHKKRRRKFPKNRPTRALKSPPPLNKIPFPLGEQLTFKVNMLNAHSGTVVLKVGRRGKYRGHSVVELSGFVRSSPFLENFYPIRDSLSVLVDERTFAPLKSDFYLKEKNRQIEYHSEFDSPKKQIKWEKKRFVKGKERVSKLTYSTPDSMYNVLSSLYALRRIDLRVGLSFEQYIWDGQRERLIEVEVIGEERVLTDMGRFDAYKIKIKGVITGGIISRRTLKRPPEDGLIWIAKDAYRTPLRAVTPTKLGQAEAVLSARAVNPE